MKVNMRSEDKYEVNEGKYEGKYKRIRGKY